MKERNADNLSDFDKRAKNIIEMLDERLPAGEVG
jgi:hypothetical protein